MINDGLLLATSGAVTIGSDGTIEQLGVLAATTSVTRPGSITISASRRRHLRAEQRHRHSARRGERNGSDGDGDDRLFRREPAAADRDQRRRRRLPVRLAAAGAERGSVTISGSIVAARIGRDDRPLRPRRCAGSDLQLSRDLRRHAQ